MINSIDEYSSSDISTTNQLQHSFSQSSISFKLDLLSNSAIDLDIAMPDKYYSPSGSKKAKESSAYTHSSSSYSSNAGKANSDTPIW